MRLADPLYESMPLVYAAIGAGAFFISYLDPEDPRTSVALCIGLVCEIAALTVFLRRQDYRALKQEYSGETIELPTRLRR
jgi:hypothetical protein